MRPKILNYDQENWLVLHFDAMSTEELARNLTQMVKASFEKEKEEILKMIPSLPNNLTKIKALNRIRFIDSFSEVSEAIVKRTAKRFGCKKKKSYMSSLNSQKAKDYHLKRMQEKAIVVKNPTQWFRTLVFNKTYHVRYSSEKELKVIQNSISNWNNSEGKTKELYLNPENYPEIKVIKIITHICKI